MNYGICRNEGEAVAWVKRNKKFIKDSFANVKEYPSVEKPFTIFMAGTPGVGKTEFSKIIIAGYYALEGKERIVRIDTDEIREFIPGYNVLVSSVFQKAASLGTEYLVDTVYEKNQHACIDTTLGLKYKAISNIQRALKRSRNVTIFYLYQDPQISWGFVKDRIKRGLRYVPKDFFIENFFLARENANDVKRIFKEKVVLTIFVMNDNHKILYSKFNIDNIDDYVKIPYTKEWLERNLR